MKKILLILCLVLSLNAMEKDKKQHAIGGMVIYLSCLAISKTTDIGLNNKTCLIPVFVAGVGKELWDRNHKGHVAELNDVVATVALPIISFTILEW